MQNRFSRWFDNPWTNLITISILTFLAYSNVFHNPFFMDDFDFIVNWPLIRDWHNLPKFFIGYTPPPGQEGIYSPIKTLIHAINYHLFGLEPFGHHVFAFLNYLVSIVIVYWIALFFLKDHFATFLCTLLFALHPVHVEYVSSLTGSVDAVGINLMFVAFYCYIKGQREDGSLNPKLYSLSLVLALISIYLHELCITLPIMFLWYDLCFSLGKVKKRDSFLRIFPFFLFSFSYVFAKYLTLGSITRGHYVYNSFYLTMLITIKAWAKYVYISIFPTVLTFYHTISKGIYAFDQEDFDRTAVLSQSIFDPQVLVSLFVLGLLGYFAFRNFKKAPLISFCIGWFFIGLLPGSNIVPSSIYFAERYLYSGSLGFCILFGGYMRKAFASEKHIWKLTVPTIAATLTVFIAVYCGIRVWYRNADARSEVALYESAVRASPQSASMNIDLGIVYIRNNMPEKAIRSLEKALVIKPDNPLAFFTLAEAYTVMGRAQEAKNALINAVAVDPTYADAYYNLAGIYAATGEVLKGRSYLEKALGYYREQGETEKAKKAEDLFKSYFGSF